MADITVSEIERVAHAALRRHAALATVAGDVARALAGAEAAGDRVSGLAALPLCCAQMQAGLVRGAVLPQVTKPRPGAILVDARHGFIASAFACGLPPALDAAQANGVATLSIGQARGQETLRYLSGQVMAEGFICLALSSRAPAQAAELETHDDTLDGNNIAHISDQTTGSEQGAGFAARMVVSIPDQDGRPAVQIAQATTGPTEGFLSELLALGLSGGILPDVGGLDVGQFFVILEPRLSGTFFSRLDQMMALHSGQDFIFAGRHQPAEVVTVEDDLWAAALALAAE